MNKQSKYGEDTAIRKAFQVIFGRAMERMSSEEMGKSCSKCET